MFLSSLSDHNSNQQPNHFALYALRQKFHSLFPHGWDFILKETPESDWKTIKKYKLTEQKCWYKYTDPEKILGLRFGTETRHGLGDIDLGSSHDPREQEKSINKLKDELEEWGITRIFFIQSSFSGGLHFYFFLDRLVNTFRLACVLNKVIEDAGLEVKRGQLETFPNTKRYNSLFNGHRLPLQQGSYLLDKDYVPESDRLEDFIYAAEWSAKGNDTDLLESRLESAYDWFKVKKNTERVYEPTPEDKEFVEQVEYAQREIKEGFLNKIRIEVEEGFTVNGETNDLLLTIAKLGRILYGLSGQQYIDYIIETVTSCPGYVKYCRHKHEINRRCTEVARFGEKQWFPYRTRLTKDRQTYKYIKESLTNQTNLNLERQHNAQSRIIQAVEYIQEQGGLPKKVGECKLAIRNVTKELFGVSVSDATLKKPENLPLWHPKHRDEPTQAPHTEQSPENVVTDLEAEEIEVSDITLAAVNPIEDLVESSNPENNTVELNNDLATPDTLDVTQRVEPETIIQLPLQAKPNPDKQHSQQSTPFTVVSKNQSESKHSKAIPSNDSKKTVHTLAYMKGVMPAILIESIYRVFQRAYYNALMRIPRLELLYQGYRGRGTTGLVQRKGEKQPQVRSISPNTEVEILRLDYHSSSMKENPNQLLVYIKPLQNSQDWLDGIAVLIEHLVPIRVRDKISKFNKTKENKANSRQSNQTNDKSSLYPEIAKGDENLL